MRSSATLVIEFQLCFLSWTHNFYTVIHFLQQRKAMAIVDLANMHEMLNSQFGYVNLFSVFSSYSCLQRILDAIATWLGSRSWHFCSKEPDWSHWVDTLFISFVWFKMPVAFSSVCWDFYLSINCSKIQLMYAQTIWRHLVPSILVLF